MTTSTPPKIAAEQPADARVAWLLPLLAAMLFTIDRWLPGWLTSDKAAWYITRAGGVTAYLLLAASTIWGLLLSTRLIKDAVPPALALALHNVLSWAALALTAVHMLALLLDNYFDFSLVHLLIPFGSPYAPLAVGLGVVAMYIALLTTVSFNWRKQIGQNNWRRLHYLTFGAFGLVTAHGWLAGSDALGVLYTVAGTLVLFLTFYRILSAVRGER